MTIDRTNHKSEAHIQKGKHEESAREKLASQATGLYYQCRDGSWVKDPKECTRTIGELFGQLIIDGDFGSVASKSRTVRQDQEGGVWADGGKVRLK